MASAKRIGSYEAKTHLPRLLQEIERGETFVITRNGKPVAELRPIAASSVEERVARIRAFRDRMRRVHGLGSVLREGETWRELIHRDDREGG